MRAFVASLLMLLALTSVSEASVKHHNLYTKSASARVNGHYDARPHAWCGWYMRHQVAADPGKAFNRAAEWVHYGASVAGPVVGAIVVWPHHVGLITGRALNGLWMVHSGNDGHAVRTRARSLSGAIAFRMPMNSPRIAAIATAPSPPTVSRENYT